MPIYKASFRSALLAAFERCIEVNEPLHKAGFLHRDISVNNIMINEDDDNPSWPSVLIDLGLAIPPELMPLPDHLALDTPQSHPHLSPVSLSLPFVQKPPLPTADTSSQSSL
ncbi:hypothetical protein IWW34DRAFT_902322 [Fusarium oxysporum f. sp. albedinis]|nr:hypothetical protein IWW34DRAFT_902322 [Fusarium oxysporum f. sp. albedinis]KAK2470752.1 hypothetical protein H9L39_16983 [Fusarium oxysporum f. sp. albedinis]